jgi:Fe-Mn family superoxide dismutase
MMSNDCYHSKEYAMSYTLAPLSYSFDALEPYIDARTMEIHYTKHHQAYVDNLNAALKDYPDLQRLSLTELLKQAHTYPEQLKTAIINQGGGHANHTFFWTIMKSRAEGNARATVAQALNQTFGSFEAFQTKFGNAAKSLFGSGWAWICVDKQGSLQLITTPNQNSPLMQGLYPILGLDVWEHAYYLHYQNRRADYIQAWWHVVNWDHVEELYCQAKAAL